MISQLVRRIASNPIPYWLWLIACILLAYFLGTYRLELQSLWYDEGVTADIARRPFFELIQWTAQDIQPPLYYIVVSAWGKLLQALAPTVESIETPIPDRWGGAWSEWSLRYVSVMFSVLSVALMASLASKLSGSRLTGTIAALLTSVHPLLFYYAQEARMYAMLTCLGILAGYLLLPGSTMGADGAERERRRQRHRTLAIFVLVAAAALYTHYFAFFLLAAFALYSLASSRLFGRYGSRFGQRALIVSHLTIILLYIPWLSALFVQLTGDASYWQGEFKLNEAAINVLISFIGGETVTERVGRQLLFPFALFTALSVAVIGWSAKKMTQSGAELQLSSRDANTDSNQMPPSPESNQPERGLLFASLLWTIVPVCAILTLAYFMPKFNARYVIIGLPGLILLWSHGMAKLFTWGSNWRPELRTLWLASRILTFGLAMILLVASVAVFAYATRNAFIDPEFTKSQWRPLARYVRKRAQPNDVVVLTSGHTWPIWNYYAPGLEAHGLPELRILDVDATVDYTYAADRLSSLFTGTDRGWLVTWQQEVVDPAAIVPLLFERASTEVPRERNYWDVDVRRFESVNADLIHDDLGTRTSVNFGNQLIMRGYTIHVTGELLLYWQQHPSYQPPQTALDLRLAGQMRTVDDLVYAQFADQPLTVYPWPTQRWDPEHIVVSRIPLETWAGIGAMPAEYALNLNLYDPAGDQSGYDVFGESGQPLGKQAQLSLRLDQVGGGQPTLPDQMMAQLWPGIYGNINMLRKEAEPGESVPLAVDWLVTNGITETAPTSDATLLVSWQNADGETASTDLLPISPAVPFADWPLNQRFRSLHSLPVSNNLIDGEYDLSVQLLGSGQHPAGITSHPPIQFRVLPSTRLFDLPKLAHPVDAIFGGQVALRGLLEPMPDLAMHQGESVSITLVWQAVVPPQHDYSVTIQLLNEQGAPESQSDELLGSGSASWLVDQVVVQKLNLRVPATLSDKFRLIVAIYDGTSPGLPRLALPDGSQFVSLRQ